MVLYFSWPPSPWFSMAHYPFVLSIRNTIEKEESALSSSFKDSTFKTTTQSTPASDALAASSIALHQRSAKGHDERQYVMSWAKGGVDDEVVDEDAPNIDSYAHVAGKFQFAKYLTGRNRKPQMASQILRLEPSNVNSLPALTKTTGTNQGSPYKQFQAPEVVKDHLSVSFPEEIKAMYKQSAVANRYNPASGTSSIASYGAQNDDDDSTHFSFQEMLQTESLVESWEKNRDLGFHSAGDAGKTDGLESKPQSRSSSRQRSAKRVGLMQYDEPDHTATSLLPKALPEHCTLKVVCHEDLTEGINSVEAVKTLTVNADGCDLNILKKIVRDCSLWRATKNNEQGQRWNGKIRSYSRLDGWRSIVSEEDWKTCKLRFRECQEILRVVYYVSNSKKPHVLPGEDTEKLLKPNQVIYTNHLSYGKVDEKLNILYLAKPHKSKVKAANSHKVKKQLALAGELEQKLIRTRW